MGKIGNIYGHLAIIPIGNLKNSESSKIYEKFKGVAEKWPYEKKFMSLIHFWNYRDFWNFANFWDLNWQFE